MALSKRHLIMAATATTLGIGGVLASGATANAATTADQTVAVAAPASQTTTTTTEAASAQPNDYYCEWAYAWDAYGNWVYEYVCYY
jgi:hypothetical protein